jgi:aryl-alcohol dehydrogenase
MRTMNFEVGSSIAILGGGAVGLSAVIGAVLQKCKTIILVEPHKFRRDLALKLGATHVIDPMGSDIASEIRKVVAGTCLIFLIILGRRRE